MLTLRHHSTPHLLWQDAKDDFERFDPLSAQAPEVRAFIRR
jgi:hypothetical protein